MIKSGGDTQEMGELRAAVNRAEMYQRMHGVAQGELDEMRQELGQLRDWKLAALTKVLAVNEIVQQRPDLADPRTLVMYCLNAEYRRRQDLKRDGLLKNG